MRSAICCSRGNLLPGVARFVLPALLLAAAPAWGQSKKERPLNVNPPPIAKDPTVHYDYDIVYVRAPRKGDNKQIHWTEVFSPTRAEPGSDLVLLHPDGREEVLVAAGDDAITDPFVSFDGESVYYSRFRNVKAPGSERFTSASADIFRIHVKTRKTVQLTRQVFTPNTGVVVKDLRPPGVFDLGPCPLPGGKVMFTSNRNGFVPTKGYTPTTLQLFVMDDDGANVEMIGHLNINSALHPTVLRDGRVMFTSYESQGLRDLRAWGVWTIHPDGTNWGPLVSAFSPGGDSAYHFMTQLSDGQVVVEEYYNLNNLGFGTYYKLPAQPPPGQPAFASASPKDPGNLAYNGSGYTRLPFSPRGLEWLTTFCVAFDAPARLSDPARPDSPRVGKVTHPSAAPDNHLLTVWSPGPARLVCLANDGRLSKHLPEGTPFGLVGTSSLYKRESYPGGVVPPGGVTATAAENLGPFHGLATLTYPGAVSYNWFIQGADSGRYQNGDIHAIRILAMEPTTDPRYTGKHGRGFWNIANERLRILGEIPVRKFVGVPPSGGAGEDTRLKPGLQQPRDPDDNPDTSFLAKLPADIAWTFQTLDKDGMVLNMAQTWHQLRPGEMRTNCGGCHSHSQPPTPFEKTAAARPDYVPFDLTHRTPLLTTRANDQSGKKWDARDETGLRFEKGVKNVEYFRDIKPILDRSCVACHTQQVEKPAGNLVLDDDPLVPAPHSIGGLVNGPPGKVPGTFLRLALDSGRFGHKSPVGSWSHPQASRYIRYFQSRRSLLVWKIHGRRTDGWSNDDFATETTPGNPDSLQYKGKALANTPQNRPLINLAYTGSIMPPPAAVAGTYEGKDGKKIKVPPLTDEDRRTIVRWIDLGCPIDLEYSSVIQRGESGNEGQQPGPGWMLDETRPTLTLTVRKLDRILVGMHDYYTGLDPASFQVVADFPIDGVPAGDNLASRFKPRSEGIWELKLDKPVTTLPTGKLTVAVKDRQGNLTRIERTFSVTPITK